MSAACVLEDVLASHSVRLCNSHVRGITRSIVPFETERDTATKVGHGDTTLEFANRRRRAQKSTDRARTSGLSINRDLRWVSTKGCDVVKGPLQCSDLITNAIVSSDIRVRNREETKSGQAIVDVHNNDIFARSKIAAITERISSASTSEAASMDPEHHRSKLRLRAGFWNIWSLNVEEKAVLASG